MTAMWLTKTIHAETISHGWRDARQFAKHQAGYAGFLRLGNRCEARLCAFQPVLLPVLSKCVKVA